MSKVYVIIPAGGSGKRIGGDLPKQFLKISDKELAAYTLEVFQKCDLVDEIIIAASPEYFETFKRIKSKYSLNKITGIVEGGKERQDSVFNALSSIAAKDSDLIAVHDAARPLLPADVLEYAINKASEFGNSVAAIKSKDTLVKGSETIDEYIDRENVYYVQTPQIFQYEILLKAMKKAADENYLGTDESSIVKRAGEIVHLIEGSSLNFKVTTQSDLELFTKLIENK